MRDVSGNLRFCFVGLGVHVQSATVYKILSLILNRPLFYWFIKPSPEILATVVIHIHFL